MKPGSVFEIAVAVTDFEVDAYHFETWACGLLFMVGEERSQARERSISTSRKKA